MDDTDKQVTRAIGQMPSRLSKLWILLEVLGHVAIIAAIWLVIEYADLSSDGGFVVCLAIFLGGEITLALLAQRLYAYPIEILTRALNTAIGERPTTIPVNINQVNGPVNYELCKSIQAISKMSSQVGPTETDALKKSTFKLAAELLRSLPVGIIAINNDFQILASNSRAPIVGDATSYKLQLDFSGSQESLESWFYSVRDRSLSATKTWTRVQNVPEGSLEDRHVYDVVAEYNDNTSSKFSLMVVTIDRTNDYVEGQEDVDFVSMAAHELRTPITAIRGYLELLDDEIYKTATKKQKAILDSLNTSAMQLTMYVNNVLNANRYDHQHLLLRMREYKVSDIIGEIEYGLNLRARTLGRQIKWSIPTNLPTVAADKSSIEEVVINLVDNAIKYSRKGGLIEVTARLDGEFVSVAVADHGIGIPASVADHLFTRFYRSHRSSAAVGGTGIGLYISRGIVESHGGTIGVSSTEGKGSVFTFTVPTYRSVKDRLTEDGEYNKDMITSGTAKIVNHSSIKEN